MSKAFCPPLPPALPIFPYPPLLWPAPCFYGPVETTIEDPTTDPDIPGYTLYCLNC